MQYGTTLFPNIERVTADLATAEDVFPMFLSQLPAATSTSSLNPNDAPSWSEFVTNYDAAAQQFNTTLSNLQSLNQVAQTHPAMLAQYQQLLAEGQADQQLMQELGQTRNVVAQWLQQIGSSANTITSEATHIWQQSEIGAQEAWNYIAGELGLKGLGQWQIVFGVVAAISLLAAIVWWISDAQTMVQRLRYIQQLESEGYSAAAAAQQATNALGPPPGSVPTWAGAAQAAAQMPWGLIVGGIAAIVILPLVIRAGSK
jgi:hypothetical protein